MRKVLLPFFLFLFSIVLFFACKKTELQPETQQAISKTINEYTRFFNVPVSSATEIKAIAEAIKKQNEEHKFLSAVIKNTGYPIWNKARIVDYNNGTISGKSSADSLAGELVYIPFVLDSGNTTNAVLAVRLNASDTAYRLLYNYNYRHFGYDTADHTKWSARDVFHLFTTFDYTVFGHTKFLIKDDSLFKRPNDSMYTVLTIVNYQGQSVTGRVNLAAYTECTTYQECHYTFDDNGGGYVRSNATNNYCITYDVCTDYGGTG